MIDLPELNLTQPKDHFSYIFMCDDNLIHYHRPGIRCGTLQQYYEYYKTVLSRSKSYCDVNSVIKHLINTNIDEASIVLHFNHECIGMHIRFL